VTKNAKKKAHSQTSNRLNENVLGTSLSWFLHHVALPGVFLFVALNLQSFFLDQQEDLCNY
jgi:hypothetical protein